MYELWGASFDDSISRVEYEMVIAPASIVWIALELDGIWSSSTSRPFFKNALLMCRSSPSGVRVSTDRVGVTVNHFLA
jgi:hypothetical protein